MFVSEASYYFIYLRVVLSRFASSLGGIEQNETFLILLSAAAVISQDKMHILSFIFYDFFVFVIFFTSLLSFIF